MWKAHTTDSFSLLSSPHCESIHRRLNEEVNSEIDTVAGKCLRFPVCSENKGKIERQSRTKTHLEETKTGDLKKKKNKSIQSQQIKSIIRRSQFRIVCKVLSATQMNRWSNAIKMRFCNWRQRLRSKCNSTYLAVACVANGDNFSFNSS